MSPKNIPPLTQFWCLDLNFEHIRDFDSFLANVPFISIFSSVLQQLQRDHSFSTFAKFSEKITFLTPDTHIYMCVSRGKKCQFFGKFCVCTKSMIPNEYWSIEINDNNTETATRGVPCGKVFLEISQKSQENTYVRVSFLIKLQRPATSLKKTLAHVFSCEFYEISKNNFLTEHLQITASDNSTEWGNLVQKCC